MNNFTDNLSNSFNISSLIIKKSENNKDIINLIQSSNKINLSETSDESSENESSENESSDNESSEVSSDSSDCIDKTKGDENLGIILNGKYILIPTRKNYFILNYLCLKKNGCCQLYYCPFFRIF